SAHGSGQHRQSTDAVRRQTHDLRWLRERGRTEIASRADDGNLLPCKGEDCAQRRMRVFRTTFASPSAVTSPTPTRPCCKRAGRIASATINEQEEPAMPASASTHHHGRTRLRRFHQALAATLLVGIVLVFASKAAAQDAATEPAKPASRADATAIIAEARRIVTPHGIEQMHQVDIGGIGQWISIRGRDRRNPVLLVIHGGPGYVSTPLAWWVSRDWEEFFTVVHWDQRAAGRTHLLTNPDAVAP